MKGSVQTHFQNMETDEGCFVDCFGLVFFFPILSCNQTIGRVVHFKTILPAPPPFFFFLLDQEKMYVLSDIWGIFMTNDWVLKPEYGISFFFFSPLAFIFALGYEVYNLHEYVLKKKNHVINSHCS